MMASAGDGDGAASGSTFSALELEKVRQLLEEFATERDWDQYHTPRNIVLAMTGEVGELAELFQWKGDKKCLPGLPSWSPREREHLGEELSDVLLYLIRLSDRCRIDLAAAVLRKIKLNAAKYPASKAYGRSDKYTVYMEHKQAARTAAVAATTSTSAQLTQPTTAATSKANGEGSCSCACHQAQPQTQQSPRWLRGMVVATLAMSTLSVVLQVAGRCKSHR